MWISESHCRAVVAGASQSIRTARAPKNSSSSSMRPLPTGPDLAGCSAGGRDVTLLRVIHHHAIGVKAPAECADGALHPLDPAPRKAVAVALVVQRDHFLPQSSE